MSRSIGRALQAAISDLAASALDPRLNALVQQHGQREGISRRAQEVSGSERRSGRAYQSARRRFERYYTAGAEQRGRAGMLKRLREEGAYVPEGGYRGVIRIPTGVSAKTPSGMDSRERTTGAGVVIEDMEEVIDALQEGNIAEAGALFGEAFLSAYTEGDASGGELDDVEWLILEFGG